MRSGARRGSSGTPIVMVEGSCWYQRPGVDAEPRRVMDGAPDDGPNAEYSDEAPAAVETARISGSSGPPPGGNPVISGPRLLTAAADPVASSTPASADRSCPGRPASDGRPRWHRPLWLLWDSDRRGPRDLWHRRRTGTTWSAPARIEKTDPAHDWLHDSFPAALVVGGEVWLFWCRDMGDRREIWWQVVTRRGLRSPSVPELSRAGLPFRRAAATRPPGR